MTAVMLAINRIANETTLNEYEINSTKVTKAKTQVGAPAGQNFLKKKIHILNRH